MLGRLPLLCQGVGPILQSIWASYPPLSVRSHWLDSVRKAYCTPVHAYSHILGGPGTWPRTQRGDACAIFIKTKGNPTQIKSIQFKSRREQQEEEKEIPF